jgi:hypothetical protein
MAFAWRAFDKTKLPAGARFFAESHNDGTIVETMRDMFAALDAAA